MSCSTFRWRHTIPFFYIFNFLFISVSRHGVLTWNKIFDYLAFRHALFFLLSHSLCHSLSDSVYMSSSIRHCRWRRKIVLRLCCPSEHNRNNDKSKPLYLSAAMNYTLRIGKENSATKCYSYYVNKLLVTLFLRLLSLFSFLFGSFSEESAEQTNKKQTVEKWVRWIDKQQIENNFQTFLVDSTSAYTKNLHKFCFTFAYRTAKKRINKNRRQLIYVY